MADDHWYDEGRMDVRQVELPKEFAQRNPEVVLALSKHHLIYSMAGLFLGLACVGGGIVLFIHGTIGSTSWTARILSSDSSISDAAPGAVLFIVGLFVTFVTRYVFKIRK